MYLQMDGQRMRMDGDAWHEGWYRVHVVVVLLVLVVGQDIEMELERRKKLFWSGLVSVHVLI